MSRIHVIHENPAWLPPLAEALAARGLPWAEWFLHTGAFDLSAPPPEGIFYNRMSASSHTRDHRFAAEFTASVLAWLTRWGRIVVNGPEALDLEISKVRQYAALEAAGVRTPRTVMVAGRGEILGAAQSYFPGQPVILKPNRGGKGLGVQLFHTEEGLREHVESAGYIEPVDGIQLLQAYIRAPRPVITRAEFAGRRFTYAVEVDTSEGFELCPADVCAIGDLACPVGDEPGRPEHNFTVIEAGTRLGTVRAGAAWPLRVDGDNTPEQDLSRRLFTVSNGALLTAMPLVPMMMTTNAAVAQSDCLFYATIPGR